MKKISIEARQGQFVPAEVHVAKGDCVVLRISHAGGIAHNAVIAGTGISSEGAPLFDHHGHHYGRAVARMNSSLSPVMLKEGWFGKGEEVLLKFQAIRAGTYVLRCNVAQSLGPPSSAEARAMVANLVVSE